MNTDNIDVPEEEAISDLWSQETLRRDREWDADKVQGVPYEKAVEEAKARIKNDL